MTDQLTTIDTSSYTDVQWLAELVPYLKDVIGMNDGQVNIEIEKRFPDLWQAHKDSIGLLL